MGDEFAVTFYKSCTEYILSEIRSLTNIDKFIFFPEKKNETRIKEWIGPGFDFHIQASHNLGEKMENAFRTVFKVHKQAVIIGTDIPDINKDVIMKSYIKLDENDFVIGPSNDGGYYLLGMNEMYNPLFRDIIWSSAEVFETTISKIDKAGKNYQLIDRLDDIDSEEDLMKWIGSGKNKLLINFTKNILKD
jgi:uncharacterized protein